MCTVWQCTTWSAIDIQDKSYKYFQEESQSEQVNEPPYVLPQCVSHSIRETLNSRRVIRRLFPKSAKRNFGIFMFRATLIEEKIFYMIS